MVNPVKMPIFKEYKSLEEALAFPATPKMLNEEGTSRGDGIDVHRASHAPVHTRVHTKEGPSHCLVLYNIMQSSF